MKIYLSEKEDFDRWFSSIRYSEYQDPKGYSKDVSYIDCSNVTKDFPEKVLCLEVNGRETVSDIIRKSTGEEISFIEVTSIIEHIQSIRKYIQEFKGIYLLYYGL